MTEYLVAPRGRGKSTNLLLWMLKNPGAVTVCHSQQSADFLYRLAQDLGFDKAIGTSQFVVQGPRLHIEPWLPVAVDNLEMLLPFRIDYATMTGTHAIRYRLNTA